MLISLFGLLVVAILLILAYSWYTPRLDRFTPDAHAGPQPAATPLQMTFSRRMDPESVASRLHIEPDQGGEFSWDGSDMIFTPAQPWPSGSQVSVSLDAGAVAARWPRLTTRERYTWTFLVAPPRLAYLYPYDARAEIYALDLQSGTSAQLTNAPGPVLDFDVDRTGSMLYFNADQGGGGSTLFRLDLLTEQVQEVLVCQEALCRYPQISPDGAYLVYERTPFGEPAPSNRPQAWLLALTSEGSAAGEPRRLGEPGHTTQQPQWSPAGRVIYFNATREAFVVEDVQGYEFATFPSLTGIPGDWDPAGDSYIFPEIFTNELQVGEGELEPLPSSRLLRYFLNGDRQDLTGTDNMEDAAPVFSPDGRWLAFGRKYLDLERWTPGRQMWLIDLKASTAQPVTQAGYYNHYNFAWSPGGEQLAYARFNKEVLTEPPEIWLLTLETGEQVRAITGGYNPQWMP